MNTLRIRASNSPVAWSFPSLTRFFHAIGVALDVMAEAKEMSRDAHKRYPFVAW